MIKVYLVQQPKSLESLALQKLVTWVVLQTEKILPTSHQYHSDSEAVESTLCHHIDLIQDILECNVPRVLHDQLFSETNLALSELLKKVIPPVREMERESDTIIEYYGIDGIYPSMVNVLQNIIWRMMESLFTKHLKFLDLKDWKSKGRTVNESHNKKLFKLSGITHLESDSDNETSTINALNTLTSLKCVTLQRHSYPNKILTSLVEKCRFIQELNISHSNINDESLDIISQLHDLKSINLTFTNANSDGIVKILLSCKNIEYIFVSTNAIAEALCIVSLMHNSDIQFKLKSYSINSDRTSLDQLKIVTQTCPKIEEMSISRNSQGQNYLAALYDLQNLHKLELRGYRFHTDKVGEFLNGKGKNLQSINLYYTTEINLNALMHIGSMCPKLETLIIKKQFENCNINCDKTSLGMPLYKNLKHLDFHVEEEANPWNDMKLLSFLLSNSPKIEYVTTSTGLSNENMIQILDKNPLACLKRLEMWNSWLRREVLDQMVENSVNFPEIINHCYNCVQLPIEDCSNEDATDYDYNYYMYD